MLVKPVILIYSQGLKHIHDFGYIHLDLKPANILITFEGVLKIGDFGMATPWPAQPGIDGEGDREYIGPEILMGQYDKPADIFALGLIMLEIAGSDGFGLPHLKDPGRAVRTASKPKFQLQRSGELLSPPTFMTDPEHDEALDKIVRWMISPQPANRPVVDQILATAGVRWAEVRRRAGATIYEGNWGPADEVLQDDAEMIDV